jgi:hypothetical protein
MISSQLSRKAGYIPVKISNFIADQGHHDSRRRRHPRPLDWIFPHHFHRSLTPAIAASAPLKPYIPTRLAFPSSRLPLPRNHMVLYALLYESVLPQLLHP